MRGVKLLNPRQVGKTTLVPQLTTEYQYSFHFVSADAVPVAAWLVQQWETSRLMMKQLQASEFLLVIDEIRMISNWSETVKMLWDTDTREGCKYIFHPILHANEYAAGSKKKSTPLADTDCHTHIAIEKKLYEERRDTATA